MNSNRRLAAAVGVCSLLLCASLAHGQAYSTPRITSVMPIGGKAGTTFELRVTGQDLADVKDLHFNFPGVKSEPAGSEATTLPPKGKGKGSIAGIYYQDDIIQEAFEYADGEIIVSSRPGLGVELDEDKLKHYRVK